MKAKPLLLSALLVLLPLPAVAELTIAVVGPMSGQFAVLGAQMKAGAEKAVAEINAAGGIDGQSVALDIGDDRCDPAEAEAIANQLAGKGAALVVGHLCFGASLAAAKVYAAHRVVMITPATTLPRLTDERAGPGIFRLAGRDDAQGTVAGNYLADHFPDAGVFIADDRSPYGRDLAEAVRTALNAAGKHEAGSDSVSPGGQDYSDFTAKVKESGAKALFFGGYYTEAALIVMALRQIGLDTVLMGGDTLVVGGFWEMAGAAGEGTLLTFPPDPATAPAGADIAAAFRADGIVPEGLVLPSYAAVELWAAAARTAGSADFDAVVTALASGSFDTALGSVSFDSKGDARIPGFAVYAWHDGAPLPLLP